MHETIPAGGFEPGSSLFQVMLDNTAAVQYFLANFASIAYNLKAPRLLEMHAFVLDEVSGAITQYLSYFDKSLAKPAALQAKVKAWLTAGIIEPVMETEWRSTPHLVYKKPGVMPISVDDGRCCNDLKRVITQLRVVQFYIHMEKKVSIDT
ncbi:hypothetical protein SARC_04554 [Sphaeroforma arctica JP610]|uniref:Uncharacterized protein n=1 Tax=Sphaeroforma arctica JP610 TaxID=667725 RepID=A0A0L0G229_9EUKA|nr:hypothetical protein SARC_04554 [Sphaeroforma arctica JP610]KNC83187.1 hypothetical protein SARC_04554 [Sphaeroforma arctica JP610]|eukprot:XP_014157089.1 hypothetical protein SARC_04554 [Sphaeroforma arctica JP610]